MVPLEEVREATEKAARSLAKQIRLPGFRPGKVPPEIVKRRFADELRSEVLEQLVRETLHEAFHEKGISPVGEPKIDDLKFEADAPLTFKVEVEHRPAVTPKDYRGLKVPTEPTEPSEEEVAAALERIREGRAAFEPIEDRPAMDGDFALVDIKGVFPGGDGKDFERPKVLVEVGGEETLPEMSAHLRNAEAGVTVSFQKDFPEEGVDPEFAGKSVLYHVQLHALKKRVLPEWDDELARRVRQAVEEAGGLSLGHELEARGLRAPQELVDEAGGVVVLEELVEEVRVVGLAEAGGFHLQDARISPFLPDDVPRELLQESARPLHAPLRRLLLSRMEADEVADHAARAPAGIRVVRDVGEPLRGEVRRADLEDPGANRLGHPRVDPVADDEVERPEAGVDLLEAHRVEGHVPQAERFGALARLRDLPRREVDADERRLRQLERHRKEGPAPGAAELEYPASLEGGRREAVHLGERGEVVRVRRGVTRVDVRDLVVAAAGGVRHLAASSGRSLSARRAGARIGHSFSVNRPRISRHGPSARSRARLPK